MPTTVLLIRHAEKPADATQVDLTPHGRIRAAALAAFFDAKYNGGALPAVGAIYAAADSNSSHRPRETVEPTSKALGFAINLAYKAKDVAAASAAVLADATPVVLICWHHELLSAFANALGVPAPPPWPGDDVYDRLWTIDLTKNPPTLVDTPQRLVYGDSDT